MKKDKVNRILIYITFALMMICLGASDAMRGVFSKVFQEHFELTNASVSLLVGISYVGNLAFLLVGGNINDRIKKKTSLLAFMILWMGAQMLFLLTDSFPVLLVGTFVALGASTILNTTMNLTTAVVFTTAQGFLVNSLYFIQGIGTSGSQSVLGNLVSGFAHWHMTSAVLLAIGVACFILLLFCDFSTSDVVKKEDKQNKISMIAIIKNKYYLIFAMTLGMYLVAEHGILNWLVKYGTDELNISAGTAAIYTSIFFGGITIGRLVLSPLVDKLGLTKSMRIFGLIGTILYVIGFVGRTYTLPVLAISGLFFSIVYPTFVMMIPYCWSKEVANSASGLVIGGAYVADIIFNFAFGPIIDWIGYRTAFMILPVSMILFAILLFQIRINQEK